MHHSKGVAVISRQRFWKIKQISMSILKTVHLYTVTCSSILQQPFSPQSVLSSPSPAL